MPVPDAPWLDIDVAPYDVVYGADGRPQLHTCRVSDLVGHTWQRCHATADVIVTRTSTFSGQTYSDFMCDYHAAAWLMAVKK